MRGLTRWYTRFPTMPPVIASLALFLMFYLMLPPRSALGLLPPPSCLVSVPLLTASQPGLAFSSPSQPTTVSWAVSNPFGGALGPLAQHQPTSSTTSFGSQPGLVSWAVGNPIGGTSGPLAQQQLTGSTPSVGSQPGLVLSPAAAPFPKKLVILLK